LEIVALKRVRLDEDDEVSFLATIDYNCEIKLAIHTFIHEL